MIFKGKNLSKIERLINRYVKVTIGFIIILVILFVIFLLAGSLHLFKSIPVIILISLFILYSIITSILTINIYSKKGGKTKKQNVRTMKIKKDSNDVKQFIGKLPKIRKFRMPKIQLGMKKTIRNIKKPLALTNNLPVNKFKNEEEKINAKIKMLEQEAKLKKLEEKNKILEEKKKLSEQRKKVRLVNKMFRDIKKKYPGIPQEKAKRKALERGVAMIIQNKDGSFTLSKIMESMVALYPKETENGMRNDLLDEIMEWIAEDETIKTVEIKKNINHYKITS